jgi:hypothetical protein
MRARQCIASALRWLFNGGPGGAPEPVGPRAARHAFCPAFAFLAGLLAFGAIQAEKPGLIDIDAYYHVAAARILAEQGALTEFPWTTESVWRERYADKEFLFHALLVPFLGAEGRPGPKALTVLLGALILSLFALRLCRLDVPWPWLWPALVLCAGPWFLLRLSITRPHLLSILLCLGIAGCLTGRRRAVLLLLSALFPWCYTAFHLPLLLALLFVLAVRFSGGVWSWREPALAAAGTLLGALLHPQAANLLLLWWAQNVQNPLFALADSGISLNQALELRSPTGRMLLWENGAVLLAAGGATLIALVRGVRARTDTVFWLLLSGGFFILYLNNRRFVEYWPFFAIGAAALMLRDGGIRKLLATWAARRKLPAAAAMGLALILLATVLTASLMLGQRLVGSMSVPALREEARWLAERSSPGELVFTGNWDDTPFVLYYAPGRRVLVTLDPTFMVARDAGAYRIWRELVETGQGDPAEIVQGRFGARWLLLRRAPYTQALRDLLDRDARFALRFAGAEGNIYELAPGAAAR